MFTCISAVLQLRGYKFESADETLKCEVSIDQWFLLESISLLVKLKYINFLQTDLPHKGRYNRKANLKINIIIYRKFFSVVVP